MSSPAAERKPLNTGVAAAGHCAHVQRPHDRFHVADALQRVCGAGSPSRNRAHDPQSCSTSVTFVGDPERVQRRIEEALVLGERVAIGTGRRQFVGIAHADQIERDATSLLRERRHDVAPQIRRRRIAVLEHDRIAAAHFDVRHALARARSTYFFGCSFADNIIDLLVQVFSVRAAYAKRLPSWPRKLLLPNGSSWPISVENAGGLRAYIASSTARKSSSWRTNTRLYVT